VDGWEMVFCTNPAQYVIAREMIRPDNEDECKETFNSVGTDEFLQYNGGVFSFRRNERTARVFRDWHDEWMRWAKRDQAALDRALYAHPLRVYTLNGVWNCITRYPDVRPEDAVILHYPMQARSWRGMINGRLDSSEAWAMVHPTTNFGRNE
jgi:Nucleotide-diphospho-sugar transferase